MKGMHTLHTTTRLAHLTVDRGVSTITLDSPHNRNALSAPLRTQLLQLLEKALADKSTRAIVLAHTGPTFCAGADLKEARNADTTRSAEELAALLHNLMTSEKPVVARLTGPARAGGIGLIAACDFAIAADTVTFAFPEVRIGVIPSMISIPLRLRVQPSALHRLFLTGETFDARYAANIGLVSAVVSETHLDSTVTELTDSLQLGAPQALTGVKQLLSPPAEILSDQFEQMQALTARYFASPEARERIRAFAETPSNVTPSATLTFSETFCQRMESTEI